MNKQLDIPTCIRDYEGGIIDEKEFLEKLPQVAELAGGTFCAPLHRLWQASAYPIEMAFEGETGASEGCSSLETPAPSNRDWTNTYFFSGGFAVKCSL